MDKVDMDAQLALFEAWLTYKGYKTLGLDEAFTFAAGWQAALASQVPAVQQGEAEDAARYRWLRNQNIFDEIGSFSPYAVRGQTMEMLDGERLDTAIDVARKVGSIVPAVCTVPSPGWRCTRAAGHDGLCAAIPE